MSDAEKKLREAGIAVPEILLPKGQSLRQWAAVACDQFTQDRAYWAKALEIAEGSASTLRVILPEAHLDDGDRAERIADIHREMRGYLRGGAFAAPRRGFVYLERDTPFSRRRRGLVVAVDLERYSWAKEALPMIRPTEGTVAERLPPRMEIRRSAPLETSHIIMLIDDDADAILPALAERAKKAAPAYSGELMHDSGSVTGWLLDDESDWAHLADALADLSRRALTRYGGAVGAARDAESGGAARGAAGGAAQGVESGAADGAVRGAESSAAGGAARDVESGDASGAAQGAASSSASGTAWGAESSAASGAAGGVEPGAASGAAQGAKSGTASGAARGAESCATSGAAQGAESSATSGAAQAEPFLFAVGDGNHSLASAWEIWNEYKAAHAKARAGASASSGADGAGAAAEAGAGSELPEHPCRYALVEIENIYDPAIKFEPIHRIVFGLGFDKALALLSALPGFSTRAVATREELASLVAQAPSAAPPDAAPSAAPAAGVSGAAPAGASGAAPAGASGAAPASAPGKGNRFGIASRDGGADRFALVETSAGGISTACLQPLLDQAIEASGGGALGCGASGSGALGDGAAESGASRSGTLSIDYIHGEDELFRLALAAEKPATGILLPPVQKAGFFETVARTGPLPRKSFSMGEACEKRFYIECRKLFESTTPP